jgi:L-asparaginase II
MIETNPVIVRRWRGDGVESIHRGAWVLADTSGSVLAHAGEPEQLVFGRSATKSFQALPLIESGAVDAFDLPDQSIAGAVSSHSGEAQHVAAVSKTLAAIGLGVDALQCGPAAPFISGPTAEKQRIMHCCSAKHAGFLALSQHLNADPGDYLAPGGAVQMLVHQAVLEITGADPAMVTRATDGCSAPTFRLPLRAMATGIARIANPEMAMLAPSRVAACQRITGAAAAYPELVAGSVGRLCTDLIKVTNGRLFAKSGAAGVYFVGAVGANRGLAIKIDDASEQAREPAVLALLQRFDLLSTHEANQLAAWTNPEILNADELVVGHQEFTSAILG